MARMTRRSLLRYGLAVPALGVVGWTAGCAGPESTPEAGGTGAAEPAGGEKEAGASDGTSASGSGKPTVAVIGAGAFGGWTALHLLRRGARVTLLDRWGPGNQRASSGGESRVIRHTYGPDRIYVDMVARAVQLWTEEGERWRRHLFHRTGVLWMIQESQEGEYEKASLAPLEAAGVQHERLDAAEIGRRFPQISTDGIEWAIFEADAGYLLAREACETVQQAVVAEGGTYRQAQVKAGPVQSGAMRGIELDDGSKLQADAYVFACGPWLGEVFPGVIGNRVSPTRQELFVFDIPAGDTRHTDSSMPVWADHGDRLWYGIPAADGRGFKVADDTRGGDYEPTDGDRTPTEKGLAEARRFMEMRFPGMKGAPLREGRVCQYENSPDTRFILDRHPEAANVWLAGGGSGHGFKHGPALGELLAGMLLDERPLEPFFALQRLA